MGCQLQKKMGRMERTGDTKINIELGNGEDQRRVEKGLKKDRTKTARRLV